MCARLNAATLCQTGACHATLGIHRCGHLHRLGIAGRPAARSAAPAAAIQAPPASTTPALSDAEIEQFLLHARVTKTKGINKGVTGSLKATLTDGKLTHDAHMQTIDQRLQQFAGSNGGVEFDFRDSWTFNLAENRPAHWLEHGAGVGRASVQLTPRGRSPGGWTT